MWRKSKLWKFLEVDRELRYMRHLRVRLTDKNGIKREGRWSVSRNKKVIRTQMMNDGGLA